MSDDVEQHRAMSKVAHMYHDLGIVQVEIAQRLGLSQARVSRLLLAAEAAKITRTVVHSPAGLNHQLEAAIERRFGAGQVHVVDCAGETPHERQRSVAKAAVSVFSALSLKGKVVGFDSTCDVNRIFVDLMSRETKAKANAVVDLVGKTGEPSARLDAALATHKLASLLDAQAYFLLLPAVLPSAEVREQLLEMDSASRVALEIGEKVDIAFLGASAPSNGPADKSASQAVGQICLVPIDETGIPSNREFQGSIVGVPLASIAKAEYRILLATDPSQGPVVRAALSSGLVNIVICDDETGDYLARN